MKKNIIFLLLLIMHLFADAPLTPLSIQLDWKYQFQHAGIIMAKERGYYKDVGLDITIKEYKKGINITEDILSGKSTFGLINTSLIYDNDGNLQPAVLLATYLQKSPLVFITQPTLTKPSMLRNKKIMITAYEAENSSLSLLLNHFSIPYTYLPHSYNINAFKNKKVDAISAFVSNELYDLKKEKIPYNIIDPADYGFVTNAMNLFTSDTFAKQHPKLVEKFLMATKQGWEYALEHPKKTAMIIHEKYRPSADIKKLTYEATVIKNLMLTDLFDIGETNKDLMRRIYKQLVRSGKLKPGQEAKILTFDDILNTINNQPIIFNKKEQQFLAKKGVIKVCGNPDIMPFEGIINGKHTGIIGDMITLIKDKTNMNIVLYPTKDWGACLNAIKEKKCDFAASITNTKQRRKYINFTDNYLHFPIVIATKNDKPFIEDIDKIKEKKLGVTKDLAIIEILKQRTNNTINLVEVENDMDGLKKVENGTLYGYINDLTVIAPKIQQHFAGSLRISGRLKENDDISIGVRNDEPILRDIFQKTLTHITPAEKQKIFNRWISVQQVVSTDKRLIVEILTASLLIFAGLFLYLMQLKKHNRELLHIARIDELTQIANRLKIDEILNQQQELIDRYGLQCSFAIFDVDDFKKVNDTYGHLAGDKILQDISHLISTSIRSTDTIGRWGGEEFMLICPNTAVNDIYNLVQEIQKDIKQTIICGERHITLSVGVRFLIQGRPIDIALKLTDDALYKAKNSGKNRAEMMDIQDILNGKET